MYRMAPTLHFQFSGNLIDFIVPPKVNIWVYTCEFRPSKRCSYGPYGPIRYSVEHLVEYVGVHQLSPVCRKLTVSHLCKHDLNLNFLRVVF